MEITLNLNADEAFCLLEALNGPMLDPEIADELHDRIYALVNTTFGENLPQS